MLGSKTVCFFTGKIQNLKERLGAAGWKYGAVKKKPKIRHFIKQSQYKQRELFGSGIWLWVCQWWSIFRLLYSLYI
jgi:hypothetical protein